MVQANPDPLEAFEEMEAAADRESDSWRPENEGDQVRGRVIAIEELTTNYGVSPMLVLVTPDDTEVRVACFGTVLQRFAYESGVEVDDLVLIKYRGKTESTNGSEYKDFRCVLRGPDGKPKSGSVKAPQPTEPVPPPVPTAVVEKSYGDIETPWPEDDDD